MDDAVILFGIVFLLAAAGAGIITIMGMSSQTLQQLEIYEIEEEADL